MSTEAGHALLASIAQGEAIELRVADIEPSRALEILAEGGQSHRVTVEGDETRITIEVGNGLVVGAKASCPGGDRQGRDAYEVLRGLGEGSILVEPLRFPSLANILVPIADLPDVASGYTRLPVGEPTVQVKLPENRSDHTVELELPSELITLAPPPPPPAALPSIAAAAPPATPSAPLALPAAALPPPAAPLPPIAPSVPVIATSPEPETSVRVDPAPVAAAPTRSGGARRLISIGAAALMLLGLGTGGLVWASQGEAAPAPARVAVPARVQIAPTDAPAEEPEAEASITSAERRQQARDLARRARRALRHGDSGEALVLARQAATLRGGLPYYQTLLGDALHANGQRPAARRAYRRALRLRPGYGPAQRRLDRSRRLARRGGGSSHT